jgi:hypothetical protein
MKLIKEDKEFKRVLIKYLKVLSKDEIKELFNVTVEKRF